MAVVPAYNEEGNLPRLLGELRSLEVEGCVVDYVVVDDGSRDKTLEVAKKSGARVISLPYNMGIGMSVQTGFRYAVSHGAELVVQVDGDGQHVPDEIRKLLPLIRSGEADVVVGTRFAHGHAEGLGSTTVLRWFAGRVLAWTVRFLTGRKITDTTSGFRLFNRNAAEFIANHYPDDYPEVEVLVILARHGFKLAETPVRMRSREHGQSSINWSRSIYYVFKVLFACFMDVIRGKVRR
jgi:glycosyltransferase involved in cell wall biosynthesis